MDALLDANVLYSIVLTDVLLDLARDRLLQPFWTEAILREAERAVTARPPMTVRDLADRLSRSGAPAFAALLAAPVRDPRNQ
jgi:hypothetical protein